MFRFFSVLFFSALLLLHSCQPGGLIKKRPPEAKTDSVLFYQQPAVSDPFLDALQTHPGNSATLKTVLFPPPPPVPAFKEADGFRVQLFAGIDSLRALSLRSTADNLTADSVYLFKDKGLFKVQAGDYLYRMSADSARRYFRSNGFKSAWVVKRKIRIPLHSAAGRASSAVPPADSVARPAQAAGNITIQVLATSDETRALQVVGQLQKAFSEPSYYKRSNGLYKIFVGRYKTREEAQAALQRVRNKGFPDAWLVY